VECEEVFPAYTVRTNPQSKELSLLKSPVQKSAEIECSPAKVCLDYMQYSGVGEVAEHTRRFRFHVLLIRDLRVLTRTCLMIIDILSL
jgi:hypothetical protein